MSKTEVKVPAMGEGITDVTITRWLVNEGDTFEAEQPLVEVATDKVDSEISATEKGTVSKIIKQEGEVVSVGEAVILYDSESEINNEQENQQEEISGFDNFEEDDNPESMRDIESELQTFTVQKHRFIPPYIRTLANEYNIPIEELYSIKGTGEENKLQLDDVKRYILKKNTVEKTKQTQNFAPLKTPHTSLMLENNLIENSEIIEMDRMRKLIADHMVRSKTTSPHVTSFIEVDVTNLVTWRNKVKEVFLQNVGEKLTYTPIFVEAVVKALKKYSMVNASVDNNKIYIKKNINIGIATALTDGNLIVPVIKDADKKSMIGLAREVNDIVRRARQNKLNPAEVKGGTFTITNLGNFESMAGTPIINQPEVAILAIGAITRKPAVVHVNGTETIGIRDIVVLSLAYDHRIIDGSLGGMFLKHVRDLLESYDSNRQI